MHRKVVTLNWSAPASGGWWDLNGTITSCIAAYQSKGAASYAASKVNLVNSGTYGLTDGSPYPSWTADNGWYFWTNALESAHLITSITPTSTWTVIVRYANLANARNAAIGTVSDDDMGFSLLPYSNTYALRNHWQQATVTNRVSGSANAGVTALAGVYCYTDGTLKLTLTDAQSVTYQYPFFIGCKNTKGTAVFNEGTVGNLYACAFYNATLTEQNIADLTTAMNAL